MIPQFVKPIALGFLFLVLMGAASPVHSTEAKKPLLVLKGHKDWVTSVAFSPDGKTVVSGSEDKTIRIWSIESGMNVRTLRGHEAGVSAVTFSKDGKRIVSGSWDKTLKIWNVADGKELLSLEGHEEHITSVDISFDDLYVLSGSGDDTLKVWDAKTGEEIYTLSHDNEYDVTSVAFSPDGQRIVSGDGEHQLKIWNAATGEELRTIVAHEGAVSGVGYSTDGQRIVSGSWDRNVKVWNALNGKPLMTLKGHTKDITSVAFSPNEKYIASASEDQTLRVWNAQTGKLIHTFSKQSENISSLAFDRKSTQLIAANKNDLILRPLKFSKPGSKIQRVRIKLDKALTGLSPKVRDWVLSPEIEFLLIDGKVVSPIIQLKRGWTVPSWKGVIGSSRFKFSASKLTGAMIAVIHSAKTVSGKYNITIDATIDNDMIEGTYTSARIKVGGGTKKGTLRGAIQDAHVSGDPLHDGVWTIHLFDGLPGGEVLSLYVDRHEGKFTAFAFSPDFTRRPLDVDTSGLTFKDSKLAGVVSVSRLNKANDGTRSNFGKYKIDAKIAGSKVRGEFNGTSVNEQAVSGKIRGEIRHRRPIPKDATLWIKCEDGYTGGAMWQNRVFFQFKLNEKGAFVEGKANNNKGVFKATLDDVKVSLTNNRLRGTLKSTVKSSGSVTTGDYIFKLDGQRAGDVFYGRFFTQLGGKEVSVGYFVGGVRR